MPEVNQRQGTSSGYWDRDWWQQNYASAGRGLPPQQMQFQHRPQPSYYSSVGS